MRADTFRFKADDQKELFVYRWLPDEGAKRKAIVHIAHGMAEHAGRYGRVAEALVAAGYAVYAADLRGHGKTVSSADELGSFGPGGFQRVVQDLKQLLILEKGENPGLPAVIFGHAMGSYLVQALIIEHGAMVRGAVLSGSSGKPNPIAAVGRLLARVERLRQGPKGQSWVLRALGFDRWNREFAPNRTAFDWLSRDEAEVDKYVADPLCGFSGSNQIWIDVLDALAEICLPAQQAKVPRDLPIYIVAGSLDPVGEQTKSLQQLLSAYWSAGVVGVTSKFYAGGRHEILNETNREEVTRDLVAWLDTHVPRPA